MAEQRDVAISAPAGRPPRRTTTIRTDHAPDHFRQGDQSKTYPNLRIHPLNLTAKNGPGRCICGTDWSPFGHSDNPKEKFRAQDGGWAGAREAQPTAALGAPDIPPAGPKNQSLDITTRPTIRPASRSFKV